MSNNTQISPREMLVNMCHFWHKKANWNPKIKKYIYWIKNWVHVFDIEKSSEMFASLLNKVSRFSSEWKTILFVSTKPQTQNLLLNIHETTWMPIVSHTWFSGLLTNFDTIKQRITLMRSLKEQFESWEIEKYTKKEQVEFKKDLEKLERALWWLEKMNKIPDWIFVVDWKKDQIALKEASKLWITVFWIMDSNTDPSLYTDWVPWNDDCLKSLEYFLWYVEEAILNNKKEKKDLTKKETWPAWWVEKLKK